MIFSTSFLLLTCATLVGGKAISLPKLNIEPGSVTASGISSGGFMSVQLHIAHSSLIQGNAVYAAGPYWCAMGALWMAEEYCMYGMMGGPKTDDLITYTTAQENKGTIDPTSNLADDNIYLFSGKKDTVVKSNVVHALEDYYKHYTKANISTEYTLAAQHCVPTLDYGEPCDVKRSPYLGDCSYDGAGIGLKTLYGQSLVAGTEKSSNLYEFDQTPYFSGTSTSINEVGYIYIPTACASGENACKLHISFHGCSQDIDSIGDTYAVHAGFNRWAEGNNIVVVYPYAEANIQLGNGNACWDWWGYTNENYALQSGVQVAFAKKVLDAIMGV